MLNHEQMLSLVEGWLVKHKEYTCCFVVTERWDDGTLRVMEVNAKDPVTIWFYVDDDNLSVFEL